MLFWISIVVFILVIVGGSVLAGMVINGRDRRRRGNLSRSEQIHLAKASGAFQHRKES